MTSHGVKLCAYGMLSRLAKTVDFGDGFGLDILKGSLHERNNRGVSLDSPKPLDFARGETCSVQEEGCKGVNSLLDGKGWPLLHDFPVDGEDALIRPANSTAGDRLPQVTH